MYAIILRLVRFVNPDCDPLLIKFLQFSAAEYILLYSCYIVIVVRNHHPAPC
jgi:hypothetical protein